ncbi:MAG TPA: phage Gp19/Gp15/Gp42 family protein [Candidatus Olsenella pullicola]|nr:phage Gp19/Gp15/Gp42 family protein [Candidatus Olsenella pullicola]
MTPFADVADYEARYGEVEDEARVSALLQDATNIIASQPGFELRDGDDTFIGVLETVACAMVHRSLMSGAYAGLSNVSQGAGGYTASVAVYNPGGDLYLTRNEKRALGIGCGRIGQTDPYGRDAR